ncbi:hypothetical protein D3879_12585 [Pseudomonas cavernicola]|uniref:Uncharacterized protein n=1 Tax=Pseudomonas cavernicola TaxID=2320866 RepID=A0A418XNG4_9PSED|nr:hypothetical protein [Pseudomonas cavernicola]RJG14010.1 hypothetical protein D3879_12585 [Pseudomonas cavernicola]
MEVAKLTASLLVPGALAALGVYIHRVTKRFEHLQWRSQKLIEKRLAVYDDLAPQLNDLLCYYTYVGGWRDLTPPSVIAMKRVVDKKIYLAAPLFSEEFFASCIEFQSLCFETYTGWGRDTCLRTLFERRREGWLKDWNPEWESCFSKEAVDPALVRKSHQRVMEAFSQDIGVHSSFVVPMSGSVPLNVR